MASAGGYPERLLAVEGGSLNVGAMCHKECRETDVVATGSLVQHGATRRVEGVNVGAMVQEEWDEGELRVLGGDMQSCPAACVAGLHKVFMFVLV
jgi:hypothetical protein